MKTYTSWKPKRKMGGRKGIKVGKKVPAKIGEWVDVTKVIKTPNVKVKKDALVVLKKSELQLQEIANFFATMEKLGKQSETLEKQIEAIEKQKQELLENTQSVIEQLNSNLEVSHEKLQSAQWVKNPETEEYPTPFCNVRFALQDMQWCELDDALYPWGRTQVKKEFNKYLKDAIKFVSQTKTLLNKTKKPLVYVDRKLVETKNQASCKGMR